MFVLYNLLLTLFSPIWLPWMIWRARQRKETVNWKERQGSYKLPPRGDRRRVWFHAVSVGEVVAALPVLRELRDVLPTHDIVLSVTTSSGHQTARDQAEGLYDHLIYFPIDVARFQLAAMQQVRPDVVVIMETELWMNFLWAAKTFDARTMLINGRISDRSFPRSQKIAFFYRALLANVDRCLMQSATDVERIKALGAKSAEVLGNTKFDQGMDGVTADPAYWRKQLGVAESRPVVLVGSLRLEEFEFFAASLTDELLASAQWIVAPRHIEKVADLERALGSRSLTLRSKGGTLESSGVLILDSYGELAQLYAIADVAIVGGGFANLGGQNVIQPLAVGLPVIHGPHMQNFRDVASLASHAGASKIASTPAELGAAVRELLADATERKKMGLAASELVKQNLGASRRYAQAIAHEASLFKDRRR